MTKDKGQVGGLLSPFLERQRIYKAVNFIPPNADILDIGCGRSAILQYLNKLNSYIGLDVIDSVLESNRILYPQHQFFNYNIEQSDPLFQKTYDIILMLAVLEHLSSPFETISKIATFLKENGKIILTTPHPRAKIIHEVGARLCVFSSEAAEEHTMFFDRLKLEQIAAQCNLHLWSYQQFQFGLNQIAVLERKTH